MRQDNKHMSNFCIGNHLKLKLHINTYGKYSCSHVFTQLTEMVLFRFETEKILTKSEILLLVKTFKNITSENLSNAWIENFMVKRKFSIDFEKDWTLLFPRNYMWQQGVEWLRDKKA